MLMAISNKFGAMVVTTGNKSEMSVGYATLYGDMNGGFNPIKDLYKTEVYALARWRNAHVPEGGLGPNGVVIPERILTKAPTAELRANQTDQDSLPPYDVLDDILSCLVEKEMPLAAVIARGHAPETVKKVERLLYLAEYKRRQAAPGVKISARNFGRDRRYPDHQQVSRRASNGTDTATGRKSVRTCTQMKPGCEPLIVLAVIPARPGSIQVGRMAGPGSPGRMRASAGMTEQKSTVCHPAVAQRRCQVSPEGRNAGLVEASRRAARPRMTSDEAAAACLSKRRGLGCPRSHA